MGGFVTTQIPKENPQGKIFTHSIVWQQLRDRERDVRHLYDQSNVVHDNGITGLSACCFVPEAGDVEEGGLLSERGRPWGGGGGAIKAE